MRRAMCFLMLTSVAVSACSSDQETTRELSRLPVDETDNRVRTVISQQRNLYETLAHDPGSARVYLQDGFRAWNEQDSTAVDWETPPFGGHDASSLAQFARKLGAERWTADGFEGLLYRDSSIAVIAFHASAPPSITVWEKRGEWRARGMRINASSEHLEFTRGGALTSVH